MTPRPLVEVADIFRIHGTAYRQQHNLPLQQLRIMRAIENCRTRALGGHVERCGHCHYTRIAYNSCRNRHCPKCQSAERAEWFEARQAELLPTPYFHVVFTLPPKIADLALRNTRVLYNLLFRISAQTLLTIAADQQHLGAEIGFFSVLHTWGQNLLYHPHVHCVVTGGGLSADHERWVSGKRPDFFVPVRVLSRLFRRLFLLRWKRLSSLDNSSFQAFWSLFPICPPSSAIFVPCARLNGSSIANRPSVDQSKCSLIFPATPIEWPSPINGSSRCRRMVKSRFSGRITAQKASLA